MSELTLKTMEIDIKGEKYTLTETTISDFCAMRSHIKSQRLKDIVNSTESMSIGEKTIIISEISKTFVTDRELEEYSASVDGIVFMLFRSISKKHPDITLERTYELLSSLGLDKIATFGVIQTSLSEEKDSELKNSTGAVEAK